MPQLPEGHLRKRRDQEREARAKGDIKTACIISLDRRIMGTMLVELEQCLEENARLRSGLRAIAAGAVDPVEEAQRLLSGHISKPVVQ